MLNSNRRVNNSRRNANRAKCWMQRISISSESWPNSDTKMKEIDSVLKSKWKDWTSDASIKRDTHTHVCCCNICCEHFCLNRPDIVLSSRFFLSLPVGKEKKNDDGDDRVIDSFRLADSHEKTRKQYLDIEHDYERFRLKQCAVQLVPKQFKSLENSPCTVIPAVKRRGRSHSFDLQSVLTPPSSTNSSLSSNLFDISSASIFKAHLSEVKSRLHSLTGTCSTLNEKLHRSEQEKRYLLERITQLERQRRDDTDALQNELNHCQKLLEKSSQENTRVMLSNIYSPPEHDLSLYDEVLLDNKQSSSKSAYQPTNYKDLFARVYDKLKMTDHC